MSSNSDCATATAAASLGQTVEDAVAAAYRAPGAPPDEGDVASVDEELTAEDLAFLAKDDEDDDGDDDEEDEDDGDDDDGDDVESVDEEPTAEDLAFLAKDDEIETCEAAPTIDVANVTCWEGRPKRNRKPVDRYVHPDTILVTRRCGYAVTEDEMEEIMCSEDEGDEDESGDDEQSEDGEYVASDSDGGSDEGSDGGSDEGSDGESGEESDGASDEEGASESDATCSEDDFEDESDGKVSDADQTGAPASRKRKAPDDDGADQDGNSSKRVKV